MRTLVILIAVGMLAAVVPAVEAAHMGPCWHEYVDNYKQLVATVKACNSRLIDWIGGVDCDTVCTLLP